MASFLQSKCLTTHSHSIDLYNLYSLYSLYNLRSLNFQPYNCTLMMIRLFWCQRNLHKMTGECCSARTIWWISGQLPIQDFRRMVDFSSICSHGTSKGEINSKRQGTFRTLTVSPWLIENASGRTSSTDKPLYFFVIHKIGQHLTKLWILETTQPYEKWRETCSLLLMICLCNYRHKLVVLVNSLVTKLYE